MKNKILLLSLLGLLFISSCKEEFQVHADYKEVCQVIGILDPDSETNYLKITKAFSSNGDVGEMAKVADSSYFPYNELTAYLIDSRGKRIKLDTTTITDKEKGFFYAPKQRLYCTKEKLEKNEVYTLDIKTKTLNVKSLVEMVKPVSIHRLTYRPEANKGKARLSLNSNTPIVNVEAIYYYRETNNKTKRTTVKSFSYEVSSKRFSNVDEGAQVIVEYNPNQFWQQLKSNVKPNPLVIRQSGYRDAEEERIIEIRIKVTAFDENIYYYHLSAQDDDGLIQDRPTYTNIKNGQGILGARSTKGITKRLSKDAKEILFSQGLQFIEY
ncbi:MAG: DUF4249 family protein [Hyphomicrobiales bacterium]